MSAGLSKRFNLTSAPRYCFMQEKSEARLLHLTLGWGKRRKSWGEASGAKERQKSGEGPTQTTISWRGKKKNPWFLERYLNCRESGRCVPNENRSGAAVVYNQPRDSSTTTVSASAPSSTKYDFTAAGRGLAISKWEQAVPAALASHRRRNQREESSGQLAEMVISWPDSFKSVCLQSQLIFASNLH